MGHITKILTVLIALLLYPLNVPWAQDSGNLEWFWDRVEYNKPDCSQVFRIVKEAHLDSVYVQKYPYSHNLTRIQFLCDTMPEYHWEHVVRYSLDTVLVRDTTVYVGGE